MELFPSLLFFAAHLAAVCSADQFEIQLVSGVQWIFSGETVDLKCVIMADGDISDWPFVLWYKDKELLSGVNQWQVTVKESGKYSCKGKRTTNRGTILTDHSKDFELDVDAGSTILRLEQDVRVGETLLAACLVRDTPVLKEVILYKDGREVLTQNGPNADLSLVNVNVQDSGLYSCRATWDSNTGMQSAQSKPIKVTVIEILTKPELKVGENNEYLPHKYLQLSCNVQYKARQPPPTLVYYFYKDGSRISAHLTDKKFLVRAAPGVYTCRAHVRALRLEEWSDPVTV